jgi:hypothetical protein
MQFTRFCIILVSKHYASKAWPNHERRAALDRAIREFDRDYILPIRLDDTYLPGLSESTAYVSASRGIDYISDLVIEKLRRSKPARGGAWPVRPMTPEQEGGSSETKRRRLKRWIAQCFKRGRS